MIDRALLPRALFLCAALAPAMANAQAPNAATGPFVAERRQDQWLATNLLGKNVYNRSDEKIGVINDLVVDRDGRVSTVVIGVGGFLGIGEKNVGVPFQDVKVTMRDNNEWLVLDRSKDDLRAAPAFAVASGRRPEAGANDRSYGTFEAPRREEPPPAKQQ
jgi:sporulation protein YlmC with PRC-barrel domain